MKKLFLLRQLIPLFVFLAVSYSAQSQNSPIGCNGQYYVSHGPISGSTGNTLLEKLLFSGSTISASSFPLAPGSIGFNAMGLNPIDGYIYAVRYPATSGGDQKGHLLRVGSGGTNQTDLGQIAALNNGEIAYSGCFDANGDFYFTTTNGRFMKIVNPVTSLTAVQIASTGFANFADIAINPVGGQMYGTTNTNTDWFFSINKSTGAITNIAGEPNLGGTNFFAGLFFDEVGQLFGYRSDAPFYLINKTNGTLTSAGSAAAYSGADGCSCSFGRVFHDLDFTQNPGNQICPTAINPNPTFPLVVSVTNQTSSQQTGLTYTLNMVDPLKRFKFTESAATIKTNLIAAGVATAGSTVTLTVEAPATGTNYNKVVVNGFQTGAPASTLNFTLQVQLVSLGGPYNPVPLQSVISGLPAIIGSTDLSNDPSTISPDDPTVITFCPNITLPVNLINFSGTYKNNNSLLNWTAENQVNFAYYELERSSNAFDFISLTIKNSLGTGNNRQQYAYTDDLSLTTGSIFYYRLKMVNIDGSYKYSNVIMIRKLDKPIAGIEISPNPVLNTEVVTARISASASCNVDLSIIDISGSVVLRQQNHVNEGINSISIYNLNRLQPGIYLLRMNDGEKMISTKFMISH